MKNLIILAFACLALAAVQVHAENKPLHLKTDAVVVDSADNVIGPVFDAQVVDKGDLFVQPEVTFAHIVLDLDGISFFLRANRTGFITQTALWFDMPNCSGNAYLLPSFNTGSSLLLPGVIFQDGVYVPDRDVNPAPVFVVSIQSGSTQCTNIEGRESVVVSTTKVMFDTSQFTPPFRMLNQ